MNTIREALMRDRRADIIVASNLLLRVRPPHASWVYRFTSPTSGRRREMGLGAFLARDEREADAEEKSMRSAAASLRAEVREGLDPIDQREKFLAARRLDSVRRSAFTLLQAMRRYHEENVEPVRSAKYAREWTFRTEHDIPGWLLSMSIVDLRSVEVLAALQEVDVSSKRRSDARQRIDQTCEWLIRKGRTIEANPAGVMRTARSLGLH